MMMVRETSFLFWREKERMNHCPFYGSSVGGISHHLSWILNWNLTVRYTLVVFFQILESLLVFTRGCHFHHARSYSSFRIPNSVSDIMFARGTRVRKLYFWHNYQCKSLIFPIARSGFLLQYLMLKFPEESNPYSSYIRILTLGKSANKNQISDPKREIDGRHWADLFSAAGRSKENASNRDGTGQQLAIFFVIAKLEGPPISQYCALHLLQVRNENGEKQAQDIRDIKKSMKDMNEIKEMITAMSIKYDQVASRVYGSHQEIEETSQEYLQREMKKSRFDAEFHLAHMCSVKKKEWIVVRLLFDLFLHDMLLWKAYSMTLQVLELGMNIRAADDMSVMLRNHGRHYVLECGQS
ncbi:unnamed protein product [Camellia sinensis]